VHLIRFRSCNLDFKRKSYVWALQDLGLNEKKRKSHQTLSLLMFKHCISYQQTFNNVSQL
jgi:hypothetical protein